MLDLYAISQVERTMIRNPHPADQPGGDRGQYLKRVPAGFDG